MKALSDYRADARAALKGNWLSSAMFVLVYVVIVLIINGATSIPAPGIEALTVGGSLLGMLIILPLVYGLNYGMLKQYQGEELQVGMLFKGYNKRVFKAILVKTLIIIAWALPCIVILIGAMAIGIGVFDKEPDNVTLILIFLPVYFIALIPAMMKQYALSQMEMLMVDNTEMTGREARLKSEELMAGKKMKLFLLDLSFIGWTLLSVFTLFIGMLWVAAYQYTARAAFYEDIKNIEE